jgi:hypothetical protein
MLSNLKDATSLLVAGLSFVSIVFLSKKDKVSRRDVIAKDTINIEKDVSSLTDKINSLLRLYFILAKEDAEAYHTKEDILNLCEDNKDIFGVSDIKNTALDFFNDKIDKINAENVKEEAVKNIRIFWQKLKEIGLLDSCANLINKDILRYWFQDICYRGFDNLKGLNPNFLEFVYIFTIHDIDISKFVVEELKVKNGTDFKSLDIEILGAFVSKTYPLIWKFIWQYYQKNRFTKFITHCRRKMSFAWKRLKEIVTEAIEPLLFATFFYIFAIVITWIF